MLHFGHLAKSDKAKGPKYSNPCRSISLSKYAPEGCLDYQNSLF